MINIEVSLGELIDRITILEIKKKMIKDKEKLKFIDRELLSLLDSYKKFSSDTSVTVPEYLIQKMQAINLTLWQVEDKIRAKEKTLEFDDEFIELSRSVYTSNDLRFQIKSDITDLYPSESKLKEQKSYVV